ncbi:MAG TPA: PqiC family protein [Candidatus Binatia bacterium]
MSRSIQAAIVLGFVILFFGGCSSFSARSDPSRFFTLSAIAVEDRAASDATHREKISLGVGPVKFPGYLDRQEIVVRSAQNRFQVSEYERWAEPLDENFTRVLAQNLAILLQTDWVVAYPWLSSRKPNFQIEIEVLRFEPNAARDVQLAARWLVIDGRNKQPLDLKESRVTRHVNQGSTEASVAALSEAVADLSREIANAVTAVMAR